MNNPSENPEANKPKPGTLEQAYGWRLEQIDVEAMRRLADHLERTAAENAAKAARLLEMADEGYEFAGQLRERAAQAEAEAIEQRDATESV